MSGKIAGLALGLALVAAPVGAQRSLLAPSMLLALCGPEAEVRLVLEKDGFAPYFEGHTRASDEGAVLYARDGLGAEPFWVLLVRRQALPEMLCIIGAGEEFDFPMGGRTE